MTHDLFGKVRRALRKPPAYVVRRSIREIKAELGRFSVKKQAAALSGDGLLAATEVATIPRLWTRTADLPFVAAGHVDPGTAYDELCPGDRARILLAAEKILAGTVTLLGNTVPLTPSIDWNKDYASGRRWPNAYFRDISYCVLDDKSDVKRVWELSRFQWAITLGQAYVLSRDHKYAAAVREFIETWLAGNPFAFSVNWTCTMEVALRFIVWSWLFHVFQGSQSWQHPAFQQKFLTAMYLHAAFTEEHLEESDINGNHYIADAAGLVFAGLFFPQSHDAGRWLQKGWSILEREVAIQIGDDGCDYEGSIAYHRLVFELLFLSAHYRRVRGLPDSDRVDGALRRMLRFTLYYSRRDGSVPMLGDSDDGRVLPFGPQDINDHRYLLSLGSGLDESLKPFCSGPRSEVFWLMGAAVASQCPGRNISEQDPGSSAFERSGYYVMRNPLDHVLVDCAPVGLAGRGGHGHNDCLSMEVVLCSVRLICDRGTFVYSGDHVLRNEFRSTSSHNTPMIDDAEINRFPSPTDLWTLHNDAVPKVLAWQTSAEEDVLSARHTGYERPPLGVSLARTVRLDHRHHRLAIRDEFRSTGPRSYQVCTRLYLAPEVRAECESARRFRLIHRDRPFLLTVSGTAAWHGSVEGTTISPSYGVLLPSECLVMSGTHTSHTWVEFLIEPQG
jgi:uncharacterized heparinase superfamily protein